MCLILFAKNCHPKYKLIVAANRDEFYQRRTQQADFWESDPNILAGRDLEAGGTWMGISTKLELAMLTNFRDPSSIKEDAPSRGELVVDYLQNDLDPESYLSQHAAQGNRYNGYNLICGTPDSLYYYSNYQEGVHPITDGIHGLSNALLNTEWPKIKRGKRQLQQLITTEVLEPEHLFEMLYDDLKASPDELPSTGVGQDTELMLSPMFIKSNNYGSRCSTVLLIDKNSNATFVERTYDLSDFSYSDRKFQL